MRSPCGAGGNPPEAVAVSAHVQGSGLSAHVRGGCAQCACVGRWPSVRMCGAVAAGFERRDGWSWWVVVLEGQCLWEGVISAWDSRSVSCPGTVSALS